MQNSNIETMVQKAADDLKKKYDEDKESALKMQYQELSMKSKREMDALRSRFKMMQTTGALLDRSPSCSESEMSLEVSILSDFFSQYAYILLLMLRNILYAFVNISSIPVVGNDC